MQDCVQRLGSGLDLVPVALSQCRPQSAHGRFDLLAERCIQHIGFITQVLLRMPEQQLAVFNMARREHELRSTITFSGSRRNDEARMPNDE